MPFAEPPPGCVAGGQRGTDPGWHPGGPGTGWMEMQSPGPPQIQNYVHEVPVICSHGHRKPWGVTSR